MIDGDGFNAPRQRPPDGPLVQSALRHLESSSAFRPSRRHRQLVRHLVERSLSGDEAALKESVIAVEVFGRAASGFDPKADSIVRVETRRLRQRLASYYQGEGRQASLRIELPIGSYVPTLVAQGDPRVQQAATRRARDLVERGQTFLRQALSQDSLEQALARFDAALRESPDHVPALVGMGRAWFNLASGNYHPGSLAAEHAAEALRRALALQPEQAETQALLGALLHAFERDWPAARRAFQTAVTLAPEQAFVQSAYGRHLLARGLLVQADQRLATARQLDPQYVNIRMHMVNLRIAQGRLADAQAELEGLQDLAPHSMPALGLAGLLHLLRGEPQNALPWFEQACAAAPGHADCEAALAGALAACGKLAEADALMARLRLPDGSWPVRPYVLAVVAARCGRLDQAFAQLARGLDEGDPNAIWLAVDPSFRPLHADARWAPLVARMRKPRTAPAESQ